MFSIYQIKDTYNRICHNINKTPILFSDKINNLTKSNIIFKAENLQKQVLLKFVELKFY